MEIRDAGLNPLHGAETARDVSGIFHPESIALIGIPRGLKPGKVFFLGLLDQGYEGPIYLVHPQAGTIDGYPAYRSVLDVPGPVALAIVMSPRDTVRNALEECGIKKVKYVILYTSGFSELGDEEGQKAEERMRGLARSGGFRILGPNCMGIYSPASKMAPFPFMPKTPGEIALLSQSGSIVNLFLKACAEKRLFFRHAVSYGNSCDIDLPELLSTVMAMDEVGLVGCYCEGTDPRRLGAVLKENAGSKPLIMWKVGQTHAGMRAASSHTGSITGSSDLWKSLFRQHGVIEVSNIEEMLDTTMIFSFLEPKGQGRVVIMSGPGGPAVSAADAVIANGLRMAALESSTESRLRTLLPSTGTSIRNPVDVGLGAAFDLNLYFDAIDCIAGDPQVDCIIIVGGGATDDLNEQYVNGLIERQGAGGKHLIAIDFPGFIGNKQVLDPLYENRVPVYPTPERAIRSYARLMAFQSFREARPRPQP